VITVLEQRGEGAGAWMCAVRGMGESVRTVRTGPVQYVQSPYSTTAQNSCSRIQEIKKSRQGRV
jgi:hypothetical protein